MTRKEWLRQLKIGDRVKVTTSGEPDCVRTITGRPYGHYVLDHKFQRVYDASGVEYERTKSGKKTRTVHATMHPLDPGQQDEARRLELARMLAAMRAEEFARMDLAVLEAFFDHARRVIAVEG